MKEKKSYTELMKSRNTQKANEFDVTMADIYIQMVLDESLYKRRIAMLTMQINKALDDKIKKRSSRFQKNMPHSNRVNKPIHMDWLFTLSVYDGAAVHMNRLSRDI